MKAFLEIIELKNDIVTASGSTCDCDGGCPTDLDQLAGIFEA